jgi:hypothetical protein
VFSDIFIIRVIVIAIADDVEEKFQNIKIYIIVVVVVTEKFITHCPTHPKVFFFLRENENIFIIMFSGASTQNFYSMINIHIFE